MDWTEFREIDAEGRRVKFWAFSLILSYSRFMYVEFVDRCDTQTIIACHERAFRAMGGVPAEILYDRQSPVYRGQQGRGGEIILNPVFEQFARHWGFEQQRTGNVSYHLRQCLGLVELYGQATVSPCSGRPASTHSTAGGCANTARVARWTLLPP